MPSRTPHEPVSARSFVRRRGAPGREFAGRAAGALYGLSADRPAGRRQTRSAVVAIHPVPRLFLGPTGNSVGLGDSDRLGRAYEACVRFAVMHLCGVGRSTEGDQNA